MQEQELWHDKSLCMQAGVSLLLWLYSEDDQSHWTAVTESLHHISGACSRMTQTDLGQQIASVLCVANISTHKSTRQKNV